MNIPFFLKEIYKENIGIEYYFTVKEYDYFMFVLQCNGKSNIISVQRSVQSNLYHIEFVFVVVIIFLGSNFANEQTFSSFLFNCTEFTIILDSLFRNSLKYFSNNDLSSYNGFSSFKFYLSATGLCVKWSLRAYLSPNREFKFIPSTFISIQCDTLGDWTLQNMR